MKKKKLPIEKRANKEDRKLTLTVLDKVLEFCPAYSQVRDIFVASWQSIKRTNFDEFLISLDDSLKNTNEKQREKIYKKFEDLDNDIILAEITNNVLFSKSKICRTILGLIAAKYLIGNEIDYVDTIIISALKELLDIEVELFFTIFNTNSENIIDINKLMEGDDSIKIGHLKNLNLFKTEVLFPDNMEKGVFDEHSIGAFVADSVKGYFDAAIKTLVTNRLMDYLKKVKGKYNEIQI